METLSMFTAIALGTGLVILIWQRVISRGERPGKPAPAPVRSGTDERIDVR